jgi:RimJ/RimL family protein N-acetyltransferase
MILQGERVRIRAARADEVPLIAEWYDSETAVVGLGPHFPRSETWVRGLLGGEAAHALLIEDDGGARIGFLRVTLGWGQQVMVIDQLVMAPAASGQGYAREALTLLCGFFIHTWGGHRVELQVRADNDRAVRCYAAVGFQIEGRRREVIPPSWGRPEDRDYLMLGLLRSDLDTPGGSS